jgi:hypothetical protein
MTERQRILELLSPDEIFILAGLGGCVYGLTRQLREQVERAVGELVIGDRRPKVAASIVVPEKGPGRARPRRKPNVSMDKRLAA